MRAVNVVQSGKSCGIIQGIVCVVIYGVDVYATSHESQNMQNDAAPSLQAGVLAGETEELFERFNNFNLNLNIPFLAIHDLFLNVLLLPWGELHHRVSHKIIV
jgi:hypothetical protein